MPKARILVVMCFAVLALTAVNSGSAWAGWLVLGSLLDGTAAIATLPRVDKNIILGFDSIEIECNGQQGNGEEIEEPDLLLENGTLEFSGCSVSKPATCTLASSTIGTLPNEALATLDGALAVKLKIKPKNANEVFATFKLNGTSCGASGKNTVIGGFAYLLPEGQDERLWHLVNFLIETEGELEVGNAPASISGSILRRLENDMLWSFH